MSKEIVHISFRSDPKTLNKIEKDLVDVPTEEPGFAFRVDYGEYVISKNNKQKTLIIEPVNEVTDKQAYEMINKYVDPNQYDFLKVVFFCLGETSGDVINFS